MKEATNRIDFGERWRSKNQVRML